MANPAKLTVIELGINGDETLGTADVIDTDGTVPVKAADTNGQPGRVLLDVLSKSSPQTVTIKASTADHAVRRSLGDLVISVDATQAELETELVGNDNDLVFTAVNGGTGGNSITVAYVDPSAEGEALAVTVTENAIEVSLETSPGEAASVETELTGEDNDLVFTAVTPGAAGNSITITYTAPAGNDQSLDVTVVGTDIDVSLATGSGGAITSTAAEVLAAVNDDGEAKLLVLASLPDGATGAGVVTAMSKTALTGGNDAGDIVSTATEVLEAIEEDDDASALVTVALADDNDGSGVVTAMAETALSGGASVRALLGPFESARFEQSDGDLDVTFDIVAGQGFEVYTYLLPKGA